MILIQRNILLKSDIAPILPELLSIVSDAFALVGALMISRQPTNIIGLLLMLPGFSLFVLVDRYLRPYNSGLLPIPYSPSPAFFLVV
jgi:hypothetical protein